MTEERVTNPRAGKRPASGGRGPRQWYYVPVLLVLSLWAGFNFWRVLQLPETTKEVTSRQDLMCHTQFSYSVFPTPSLLYPDAKPLTEGKSFFTKVTKDVEMKFTTRLEPNPPIPLSGTYEVWLVLEAPELWQRGYLLQGETKFANEKGQAVEISGAYNIGLQERLAFAKAVEEETGVSPREGYNLYLRPVLRLNSELPAGAKKEFRPEFGFSLRSYQFASLGEKQHKEEQHLSVEILRATLVPFFGRTLPLATARYLFGLLTLPGLIAAGALLRRRLRLLSAGRKACEGTYINRRYRSRIICVQSIDGIPGDRPVLRMGSFAELLRVADEREKPVVLVQTAGNLMMRYSYYVLDEENLYNYVTTETLRRTATESLSGGVATEG